MTRDDLKTAVRSATRESVFTAWRLANGMPEHSGRMTKDQWQVAYDHFCLNMTDAAETETAETETTETQEPETMSAETTETQEPETTAENPLASIEPFMSEAALAPIQEAFAAAERARDAAETRATKAERLANKAVLDAHNATATAKANAAPVPVSAPSPVPSAPSDTFVPAVVSPVAETPLCDLIPGAKSDVKVTVCDFAGAPEIDPNYIPPAEFVETMVWQNTGANVALYGDRGTGKSSLVRYAAAVTRRPYFEIAFHSETSNSDLFGFEGPAPDGGTQWVHGDLLKAMLTPYALIDLSELANARPELVMTLNPVLETASRQIYAGGKVWKVAEGVQFYATTNDNGTGENAHKFAGVRPMNEATRSRLVWVNLELPGKAQLARVIAKQTGIAREGADMVADIECKLRDQVKAGECENTFGLRALVSWVKGTMAGLPSRKSLDASALNSASAEDIGVWQNESVANFDHKAFEAICRGETPVAKRDGFTAV